MNTLAMMSGVVGIIGCVMLLVLSVSPMSTAMVMRPTVVRLTLLVFAQLSVYLNICIEKQTQGITI